MGQRVKEGRSEVVRKFPHLPEKVHRKRPPEVLRGLTLQPKNTLKPTAWSLKTGPGLSIAPELT